MDTRDNSGEVTSMASAITARFTTNDLLGYSLGVIYEGGLMDFLLRSGQTWTLHAVTLTDYQDTFRRVAVVAELRKAQAWLVANPQRRKTLNGMPRFLTNWLLRADGQPHNIVLPVPAWECPHTPQCAARWHCMRRDEFERVKAEVVKAREAAGQA